MSNIILSNQSFWSWLAPQKNKNGNTIESCLRHFGDNQLDKDYIIALRKNTPPNSSSLMNKLAVSVPRMYFLELQFCAMVYGKIFSQVFPPLAAHVDQLTYIEWLLYVEPENMKYRDHLVHMFKVAFVGDQLFEDKKFLEKVVELQFNSPHFKDWQQAKKFSVVGSDKETIIKMAFFLTSIFHDFGYGYFLLRKYNDKVSKINEWLMPPSDFLDFNSPFAQIIFESLPASFIETRHEWLGKNGQNKDYFRNKSISGFFRDCLPLNHSIASCFFILDIAEKLRKARALKSSLYIAFQLAAEAAMIHDMTDNKRWMHLYQEKNACHFLDQKTQESVPLAMLLILADELSIWNRPRIESRVEYNGVRHSMKVPKNTNIKLSLNENTLQITSTPKEWVREINSKLNKMEFLKSQDEEEIIEVLGYKVNLNV